VTIVLRDVSTFVGNYITAELMSESTYHLKFPGAIAAIVPLRL
jgi:hypothetical protein